VGQCHGAKSLRSGRLTLHADGGAPRSVGSFLVCEHGLLAGLLLTAVPKLRQNRGNRCRA
jgi:hypothetical protein